VANGRGALSRRGFVHGDPRECPVQSTKPDGEDETMKKPEKRSLLPKPDFKKPPLSLLAKLGSIAVHAEEMLSPEGHAFDKTALEQLLKDPEVVAWIKDMGALLPRKR
jgi:hypothetical protein